MTDTAKLSTRTGLRNHKATRDIRGPRRILYRRRRRDTRSEPARNSAGARAYAQCADRSRYTMHSILRRAWNNIPQFTSVPRRRLCFREFVELKPQKRCKTQYFSRAQTRVHRVLQNPNTISVWSAILVLRSPVASFCLQNAMVGSE
jgi:hypothetical protein